MQKDGKVGEYLEFMNLLIEAKKSGYKTGQELSEVIEAIRIELGIAIIIEEYMIPAEGKALLLIESSDSDLAQSIELSASAIGRKVIVIEALNRVRPFEDTPVVYGQNRNKEE